MRCPVLIENTAGGDRAMARRLEAIERLWEVVGQFDVGFCLDTCHAHAGGIELASAVDAVKAITGRIDLVHCNDSRDTFDSGADRHANIGAGQLDPDDLAGLLRGGWRADPGRDARPTGRPPTSPGSASGSASATRRRRRSAARLTMAAGSPSW